MSELQFYDLTYEGPVVQAILDTAQELRQNGYIFKGVGTTSTAPGTPTERVWYICGPGTYANFGTSVTVPEGSVMVAQYASGWTTTVIEVSSAGSPVVKEIDLSDYQTISKTINSSNVWTTSGNHYAIPCDGYTTVRVKASAGGSIVAYLHSDVVSGTTPPFVSGTSRVVLGQNEEREITLPDDCLFLYAANSTGSYDIAPAKVEFVEPSIVSDVAALFGDIDPTELSPTGGAVKGVADRASGFSLPVVWHGGTSSTKLFYTSNGVVSDFSSTSSAARYGCAKINVSALRGGYVKVLSATGKALSGAAYNLFVDASGTVLSSWQQTDDAVVKQVPSSAAYLLLSNYFASSDGVAYMSHPYVVANAIVTQWCGKQWYAYGTSLTNIANEGKYPIYVQHWSGMVLTNKGVSGGGLVSNTNLKNAVMNITDGKLNADIITLECLANDADATFGTVMDTDGTTFLGALSQCIKYLQQNVPNAQIVIIASPQGRRNAAGTIQFTPTYQFPDGTTYAQRYDMMGLLCEMYGVWFVNPNYAIGYYRKTDDYYVDNIHHTDLGGKVFGSAIWEGIKKVPLWFIPNN